MCVSKIPFGLLNSHCLSQHKHLQPNYTSSPCALILTDVSAGTDRWRVHSAPASSKVTSQKEREPRDYFSYCFLKAIRQLPAAKQELQDVHPCPRN